MRVPIRFGAYANPSPRSGSANAKAPPMSVNDGRVTIDDVSFTYDGGSDPSIDAVSLTAETGELIGIVGATCAAKSTLMNVLFGFYDPDTVAMPRSARDGRRHRPVVWPG